MGKYAEYYRIRERIPRDREAVYRALQRSTGAEHPEKIKGCASFFFETGDVFVSGSIAQFWHVEEFRTFVFRSLRAFEKQEYGEISSGDEKQNTENRCLFGGDLFGRYGYFYERKYEGKRRFDEFILIRTWKRNTWISFDSELDMFLFLGEDPKIPDIDERPHSLEE